MLTAGFFPVNTNDVRAFIGRKAFGSQTVALLIIAELVDHGGRIGHYTAKLLTAEYKSKRGK